MAPAGSARPTGPGILLDRVLGLTQAEAPPGLREAVCDLSLRLPFRQAAETGVLRR
jgi:hypothetical protein